MEQYITPIAHTVFDKHIMRYLSDIDDIAERENVPYCVVGGLACQLNMANAITTYTHKPLSEYKHYVARGHDLEDKFRPTEDIDLLSLRNDKKQHLGEAILKNVNYAILSDLDSQTVHGYFGKGCDKTILNISVDFSTGISKELCEHFVEKSKKCELPYKNKKSTIHTKVLLQEHMIAVKICGALHDTKRRVKDTQDIRNTVRYVGILGTLNPKIIEATIWKISPKTVDEAEGYYNSIISGFVEEKKDLGNTYLAEKLAKYLI